MFVTRTVEYEIDDYLGEGLLDEAIDDNNYIIAVDDRGNTITYYDLDAKNQIIFLETFQKQFDAEITYRINALKRNIEIEVAATG